MIENTSRPATTPRSPRSSRLFGRAAPLAALALALAASSDASAVGTRTFTLDSLDALKGGDLTGVSVDSSGTVRAGLTLGAVPLDGAQGVWSALASPDGALLVGTGNDGKVYRVVNGQVTTAATTGALAVASMAFGWNGDAFLGTFPDGKIHRMPSGGAGGKQAATFTTLPGAEDVWALAFDPRAKVLYAATGPEGKIFRVDQAGRAQVYFDSDEPHLVSLALGADGSLYAGSNGKALLYRVTGPGRATVEHDFDGDDVKAIAPTKDGVVYAISNEYGEAFAPPKRNKTGPSGPSGSKPSKPGKGKLVRIKAGVVETMLDDKETHFVSLDVGDDGLPYVGTGAEGRVYSVDDSHRERLVVDTDERQVGAITMAGKRKFIATSDPAVVREIKGRGGADAVWTSKVLDAGLRANFGRLHWRSDGQLEFSTRSGNTSVPDGTWSAWSPGLPAPGDVKSPPGRYVQVRARWSRDPNAVLREVTLAFVTDNARPVVTSIGAESKGQKNGLKTGVASSGGDAPKPTTTIKLTWKVDNPDEDDLRYRLFYRLEGETKWKSLLKPGEKLTASSYEWDTTTLPEGTYRILVEASDELANPPDRVQRHALESSSVLVDNTPPVFRALSMQGRRLQGEIVDGLGPVSRIEVSVAGSDEWRPIFPRDSVFDEPAEPFDADVGALVPAGPQLVAVRAYDAAGNAVTRNVEAK